MAGDSAISGLINDFRQLQFEAKKTVSQLNETKGAISGGLGSAGTGGALSFSGGQFASSGAVGPSFDAGHAKVRRENTNLEKATTRRIRTEAKYARGLMTLGNDVLSGDPELIMMHGVSKVAKMFRKTSKFAGQGAAVLMGVHEGDEAYEAYTQGDNFGAANHFLKGIAAGAMMGGPMGAAAAFLSESLTFAYQNLKPVSLREWLHSPLSSLGGAARQSESEQREATRQVIQAFRNIYGGGEIRASTITKILDSNTEPEKLKADIEKMQSNLDKGYIQIGLGNFDKGIGLIRDAKNIDKKYGFLGGHIVMDPASIYQTLESQRMATRNFAASMTARGHDRTGD